jgi:hypothetical protein
VKHYYLHATEAGAYGDEILVNGFVVAHRYDDAGWKAVKPYKTFFGEAYDDAPDYSELVQTSIGGSDVGASAALERFARAFDDFLGGEMQQPPAPGKSYYIGVGGVIPARDGQRAEHSHSWPKELLIDE